METLIQSKIIFVVNAVRLPLIIVVVVVIVVCRRHHLSTATLLAVPDREAIGGCRHSCRLIDYPQVESRLFSSHLSRAMRMERFDGSAIRDNRARSAIRFVRMRESHV